MHISVSFVISLSSLLSDAKTAGQWTGAPKCPPEGRPKHSRPPPPACIAILTVNTDNRFNWTGPVIALLGRNILNLKVHCEVFQSEEKDLFKQTHCKGQHAFILCYLVYMWRTLPPF